MRHMCKGHRKLVGKESWPNLGEMATFVVKGKAA